MAAHSYFNNIRYSNTDDLNKYIEESKLDINYRKIEEKQDKEIQMNEFIILGLRMIKGFSIKDFKFKFNIDPRDVYKNEIEKLVKLDLISVKEDNISLTNTGIDFANIVWSEFV